MDFLRVVPFDNAAVFKQEISSLIKEGDETGFEKLASLVRATSLRRVKTDANEDIQLQHRHEIIERVELDASERQIYDIIKRTASNAVDSGKPMQNVLQAILKLRQVSNHGRDLLSTETRAWLDAAQRYGTSDDSSSGTCENCFRSIEQDFMLATSVLHCFHQVCFECLRFSAAKDNVDDVSCPICYNDMIVSTEEITRAGQRDMADLAMYRPSSKVKALLKNLASDGCSAPDETKITRKRYAYRSM